MVKTDPAWDSLWRAVRINNRERVEELLDLHYREGDAGCPALAADADGWNLLTLAASRGHWELVNTFIRLGVDVNQIATWPKGTTPLHECAATKDGERGTKVAEDKRFFLSATLLLEAGANPWQENAKGLTPVEVACAAKNVGLKTILESKAFFAGKPTLPRKGSGSKLYHVVVAPRCPLDVVDKAAEAFPLWMSCYKADKVTCEEAFKIPLDLAKMRLSRLPGDNAAFLVLGPGRKPPKKLSYSGNAADGFVIEIQPARGDSNDLLAKLVDLLATSGGVTNWDAIQHQLTSKPDQAGAGRPQLITISAQAQLNAVHGLPAPQAAAQNGAAADAAPAAVPAAPAVAPAPAVRRQPAPPAAASPAPQPVRAPVGLARETPTGLARMVPWLAASEPSTPGGSSARGSSSGFPGTPRQQDEPATGHPAPTSAVSEGAGIDAAFAEHCRRPPATGATVSPRDLRAPTAVEQWVQPPPAQAAPWVAGPLFQPTVPATKSWGRAPATRPTPHRQAQMAAPGSATTSRASLATSDHDSLGAGSVMSEFKDLSVAEKTQPAPQLAQPNPAQQGDPQEANLPAAPAAATNEDDDDWMAEYQAALAAGKFEMTEYEKMVLAQQQLEAKRQQHPAPHKAASAPAIRVPVSTSAVPLPESSAASRPAAQPSAPPALMDDYPAELPTRASLPVGVQQQAPETPARRPRDDFEDSLSCPITQELMTDPVLLLGDGQSYERAAIELWLRDHDTSPMTGVELTSKTLQPNFTLRSIISAFRAE